MALMESVCYQVNVDDAGAALRSSSAWSFSFVIFFSFFFPFHLHKHIMWDLGKHLSIKERYLTLKPPIYCYFYDSSIKYTLILYIYYLLPFVKS